MSAHARNNNIVITYAFFIRFWLKKLTQCQFVCICVYICMYMYVVCMFACIHVFMNACICIICIRLYAIILHTAVWRQGFHKISVCYYWTEHSIGPYFLP